MTTRRTDEILDLLALDVQRMADFARRLELTVFGDAEVAYEGNPLKEMQKFDALIQHLDDLEAILRSVADMTCPEETVNAETLAEVARLGHYRRIFGLPGPAEPVPEAGHVDLF
ncbi:MAG: hypothetical protein EP318_17725 [Rhodobacteraceae bacterium]|nr:MAG: hypothetical protein EP318_17725 [Paracoccaceae bacterium]